MENVGSAVEVARGISDFGMSAMTAAFFLVLSGLMMADCFRWFQKIVNRMIENDAKTMGSLIAKAETQIDLLNVIVDWLRPETRSRIEAISNTTFDLAVEKVCRIIKKVKEENNIADKEATKAKIRTLLSNLHYDRNSRFDTIKYRGRSLASYTNPGGWRIGWPLLWRMKYMLNLRIMAEHTLMCQLYMIALSWIFINGCTNENTHR